MKNLNSKGNIRLQMYPQFVRNDIQFIRSIVQFLMLRSAGKESSTIDDFKSEASAFIQRRQKQIKYGSPLGPPETRFDSSNSGDSNFQTTRIPYEYSSTSSPSAGYFHHNQGHSTPSNGNNCGNSSHRRHTTRSASVAHDSDLPDDHKQSQRFDYEKSEPIVRLLAQVRKVGMDILFPQSTHDKVYSCTASLKREFHQLFRIKFSFIS